MTFTIIHSSYKNARVCMNYAEGLHFSAFHFFTELLLVFVTADRNRVGAGSPVTLTCTVIGANQKQYNYSWTRDGVLLGTRTSSILTIPSFSVRNVGTYVCEVLSAIGVVSGRTALEEGGVLIQ